MTEIVLPRTSPERQGIASADVLRFVEALEGRIGDIHSITLVRHGAIVAEGWWAPYPRDLPHMLYSLSKSFTSSAVGIAIAEGRFSLDDTVVSFFPEHTPAAPDENLLAMRVRHLLSMSTGHTDDTWLPMVAREDGQWVKAFLEQPVRRPPGTHFLYNTGASYMLSAIIHKTTSQPMLEYLQPRLFEPLGIKNPTWLDSPERITLGGLGLSLTTSEAARFGQLYLQQGVWQGQQLIPAAWVAEATAFQTPNGDYELSDWTQGYGYQFWRSRHNAYRGDGAFGQFCVIMPEQDAVLAITGGLDDMQAPLDILWDILLPAMKADTLPDAPDDAAALAQKLATLHIPPVAGEATTAVAAQVSGQTFVADANPLGITSIRAAFTPTGCTITAATAASEETFPCGAGEWHTGTTALFNTDIVFGPTTVAASGAWTSPDTYSMVVRLIETPYVYTLRLVFAGEQLLIESRINVSFNSTAPVLITAHVE